ncbi:MAG: hypothetical protein JAY90_04255 [Candidatus Thiodiazotropha lotti]|nr:hypothetical protein [Candidatus Thiodiazotropha lotti]
MSQQSNSNSIPQERTQAAVDLDNLIRRHLRVSDPSDADAVSKALRNRYQDDQLALEQEAAGLPFFKVTKIEPGYTGGGSSGAEIQQARNDVNQDLQALSENALLKDIHPELRGWAHNLRQVVAEGVNAARFAQDPWQRDRAMAARRLLGDYARVARYVGALTPNMSIHYRQLAKSLDEVANMILVTMGEAVAQSGHGGGRFLLQAPASELQARREAVVNALRNLVGTSRENYGSNDWPRGLVAYREVINYLEDNGLTDLRALFQENHVARSLDDVVFWSTRGSSDDLRALGATALLALERFRRLDQMLSNRVDPESPALATYLSAIRLFLDTFENAGSGYRLLYIARPPISFYGLYGVGGPDDPTQRMLELIQQRGKLAQILDCYLGCDCGEALVRCQIMLDKLLYDTDRSIDLYAMSQSTEGSGPAEQRAMAYGLVADRLLRCPEGSSCEVSCTPEHENDYGDETIPCNDQFPDCSEVSCVSAKRYPKLEDTVTRIRDLLWMDLIVPVGSCSIGIEGGGSLDEEKLSRVKEELCAQQAAQDQWEHLLQAMAPSCRIDKPLDPSRSLVESAMNLLSDLGESDCPQPGDIPPHFETSLASFMGRTTEGGYKSED